MGITTQLGVQPGAIFGTSVMPANVTHAADVAAAAPEADGYVQEQGATPLFAQAAPLPAIARAPERSALARAASETAVAAGVLSASAMLGGCDAAEVGAFVFLVAVLSALKLWSPWRPLVRFARQWIGVATAKSTPEIRLDTEAFDHELEGAAAWYFAHMRAPAHREDRPSVAESPAGTFEGVSIGVLPDPFEGVLEAMRIGAFDRRPEAIADQERLLSLHFSDVRIISGIDDIRRWWQENFADVHKQHPHLKYGTGYALMKEPDGATRLYLYNEGLGFRGFAGEKTLYSGKLSYDPSRNAVSSYSAYPRGGESSEETRMAAHALLAELLGAEHVFLEERRES